MPEDSDPTYTANYEEPVTLRSTKNALAGNDRNQLIFLGCTELIEAVKTLLGDQISGGGGLDQIGLELRVGLVV